MFRVKQIIHLGIIIEQRTTAVCIHTFRSAHIFNARHRSWRHKSKIFVLFHLTAKVIRGNREVQKALFHISQVDSRCSIQVPSLLVLIQIMKTNFSPIGHVLPSETFKKLGMITFVHCSFRVKLWSVIFKIAIVRSSCQIDSLHALKVLNIVSARIMAIFFIFRKSKLFLITVVSLV